MYSSKIIKLLGGKPDQDAMRGLSSSLEDEDRMATYKHNAAFRVLIILYGESLSRTSQWKPDYKAPPGVKAAIGLGIALLQWHMDPEYIERKGPKEAFYIFRIRWKPTYTRNNGFVLDWSTNVKIAIGTSKGLTVLHDKCDSQITHRDIKSTNILLVDSFEAKL